MGPTSTRHRAIILGAAGMDYHLFNTVFRENEEYEVVAFTMAPGQNLGTVNGLRRYPAPLAGRLYPDGIPTYPESELEDLVQRLRVDEVVLAYSDLSHNQVMGLGSRALVAGADFRLVSPRFLQLEAERPVIAVCAVRTGCGKSQTSRRVYEALKAKGLRPVAVREPMPYGELEQQVWQRFASYEDLDAAQVTIEEREEYEPYIENGMVIYAGCDYREILRHAETEASVIVWDGGNNEISFFRPDCLVVVTDPLRAGSETTYHPGEENLRMADIVVINKEDSARKGQITKVVRAVKAVNPRAVIIHAESPLSVSDPDSIRGKRVLVVEDGPTVTHGNMAYGAGRIAAERFGAGAIVNPKPYVTGSLAREFRNAGHLEDVLPAMGYSHEQLKELEEAVNAADCDAVVSGTPIDLSRIISANKPIIRVKYRLRETSKPDLEAATTEVLARKGIVLA